MFIAMATIYTFHSFLITCRRCDFLVKGFSIRLFLHDLHNQALDWNMDGIDKERLSQGHASDNAFVSKTSRNINSPFFQSIHYLSSILQSSTFFSFFFVNGR